MTQVGSVYGQALYDLAKSEDLSGAILQELSVLEESFSQSPDFLRLLAAQSITKQERCTILDDSFRGKLHPYVLNFLKILTEKGHIRHFSDCCMAYRDMYYQDQGILLVEAVTASPLTIEQTERLTQKLVSVTGKQVELQVKVDPNCLGGICLTYDGKQVDGTVKGRLEVMEKQLKNTVL